ncbi:cysteine proteinase [Hysterangium stoloniferum]|nr:cysteine proteinase [Hysterangium stoloniferum]
MIDIKYDIPSFYSPAQLQAYLNRIGFSGDPVSLKPDFKNLEYLVQHHLTTFPFENTRLHYEANHEVNTDPQFVYSRLVEKREGGSWCCGHNGIFLGMLRALGYRAIAVSGRVNQNATGQPECYTFLSHMFCFVQLSSEGTPDNSASRIYLVDVGFGGTGPIRPLLLEVGQTVQGTAFPEEHRIMRASHPQSSLSDTQWALEYRCGSNWSLLYIFNHVETYPADWIAYCQWFCAHPTPRFKANVVCVQYFVVEDGGEGESGPSFGRLIMFGNKVQRRVGLESTTVKEFATERERIQILKEDFGVLVQEGEVQNIMNTLAALPL